MNQEIEAKLRKIIIDSEHDPMAETIKAIQELVVSTVQDEITAQELETEDAFISAIARNNCRTDFLKKWKAEAKHEEK